jgi:hypothetical protein
MYRQEFNDCCDDKKYDRRHPAIEQIGEHVVPLGCDRSRAGPRHAIDFWG